MTTYINKAQLQVDTALATFIKDEVLPGIALSESEFWSSFAKIINRFTPQNKALLATRDDLQKQLDEWNIAHQGKFDVTQYNAFLTQIGYLVPEGPDFTITTSNVDSEICQQAGPQLVVPASNARFALNAANARWGSLYDALYGTDVISEAEGAEKGDAHNPVRAQKVVAYGRQFLDTHFPLTSGLHADSVNYHIAEGQLVVALSDGAIVRLRDSSQLIGYQGEQATPTSILLSHNGLRVAIEIDATSPTGKTDPAHINDLTLEAALTTIQDFEDSVVAVDANEKVHVYRNWLGLMKGDLTETIDKGGRISQRVLRGDKQYTDLQGQLLTVHGRSLLFCRNVGHLMTNPAILDEQGNEVPEGIMDGMISSLIAMHDLQKKNLHCNSRNGNIYIVKPKMHGPDEVAFANELFDAVEDALGLARDTIKIGVMDEERRTTVNLKECIRQVSSRVVFVNTGFLDRTGDELHTSMLLGPFVPKGTMKAQPWIKAYEDWNVDIALACGFSEKAQIGKGMWAVPDEMAAMMKDKIAHPQAGANTAWVPSPTGATLHAMHYHQVNVLDVQHTLMHRARANINDILTVPLLTSPQALESNVIADELNNNVQGLLGYVVRWIDLGMGASKVPDINDIGLMEDRATLRISSQHICNWLAHGILNEAQIIDAFEKMAVVVDAQNAHDPLYRPMSPDFSNNLAFQAALDLVLKGLVQPNGYTEPLLHAYRQRFNASQIHPLS